MPFFRIALLVLVLVASVSCAESSSGLPGLRREPLSAPRVLAYYYPWYGTPDGPSGRWFHWNPHTPSKDITNTPTLGLYDSKDTAVVRQHIRWAKEAGIDGFIASWWGTNTFEDEAMPVLLHVAEEEDFQITVFMEDAANRQVLRDQVTHLLARYAPSPAWMREGGRPVIFVYTRVINAVSDEDLVWAFQGTGAFVVGDGIHYGKATAFQGTAFYNPSDFVGAYVSALPGTVRRLHREGRIVVATAMPGYDDTPIRTPGFAVQRDDGAFYRRFWRAATESGADWVAITSFNEWHEGSEIEPSREYGHTYLKMTRTLADEWRAAVAKRSR